MFFFVFQFQEQICVGAFLSKKQKHFPNFKSDVSLKVKKIIIKSLVVGEEESILYVYKNKMQSFHYALHFLIDKMQKMLVIRSSFSLSRHKRTNALNS